MAGGDGFTDAQRASIDKAIRDAETVCRFEFSVYVGKLEGDPRLYAERLHAALVAPARSVLIAVDPAARVLEVVTGDQVRRSLEDHHVRLAVVEMQSQFAHDDLCGGIVRGINMLAGSARRPPTLHA
ncbi:DUF5130 family protein [Nocardioides caldifontis]|uniref:DUF5130 family protein n=1 Tax=Nocardioides caldifontis TaxID=2588938 RepID=UPI0011E01F61|nr:DUF5130 family protein [Nocardioides caldifontis]